MKRHDFAKEISEATKNTDTDVTVSIKAVEEVLKVMPDVIKNIVKSDDNVTISGFMTINKKHIPERKGTIMMGEKKGQKYSKPAHDEVGIKLSKTYKTL